MTEHPGIDKISFTGSIATGKKVMESCSKTLKRVTLELGGNDPAIVCADVDLAAIPTITGIAFENAGQICCGIKRLYVHESVYDTVMATVLAVLPHLKFGDGFVDGVFIPPITNKQQFERVQELLADAERAQLKVVAGSTKPMPGAGETGGYFIAPTVIDNPPDDSKIVTEEQFGKSGASCIVEHFRFTFLTKMNCQVLYYLYSNGQTRMMLYDEQTTLNMVSGLLYGHKTWPERNEWQVGCKLGLSGSTAMSRLVRPILSEATKTVALGQNGALKA